MAGRGGYQKPRSPAPVSGPGKFSRRTDGQPSAVPNVGDSPDLQYGDRQALEAAQGIAGIPGAAGASVGRRLTGAPPRRDRLPDWMFTGDDPRPNEPTTAGMELGPGPGSEALMAPEPAEDMRELTLEYVYQAFANEEAREMLFRLREERAAKQAMPPVSAPTIDAPSFSAFPDEPGAPPGAPVEPEVAPAEGV